MCMCMCVRVCPQGFLTAVLQNHARNTSVPIDRLNFKFNVMSEDAGEGQGNAPVRDPPQEGVYVNGLFLESATWQQVGSTVCRVNEDLRLTLLCWAVCVVLVVVRAVCFALL